MQIKIGLETHIQLNPKSKIFCGCANPITLSLKKKALTERNKEFPPNTLTCDTCLGMPGTKPRANRSVIEMATKVALALTCKIAFETFFSRKTYFYPDMNKNFQITQFEIPLAEKGTLEIVGDDGGAKRIRIRRLHIEEDPAKLVHIGGLGAAEHVLVDYNRAGIPLIEVVTEPDFGSAEEARRYLAKLIAILEYLGVYDSTSEAVVKSDANVSVAGGAKVEVKNITGTAEIEKALNYEIRRQQNELRRGRKVIQETRAWDPAFSATRPMRIKEEEAEYGYIFEPDLTKIELKAAELAKLKKQIPELPDAKRARFMRQYRISATLADGLVSDINIAELFEQAVKKIDVKVAASWIAGPLLKTLNWNNLRWANAGLKEKWIFELLKMFASGKITKVVTEQILRTMVEKKKSPQEILKELKIKKVTKADEVEMIVQDVLAANQKAIADYKAGEKKALEFLVGQVVKASKGTVDAKIARELILKKI